MEITIEKRNFESLDIEAMKPKCNQALDALWQTQWVKQSMEKKDMGMVDSVNKLADEISDKCDTVVVIASGKLGRSIKAAVSATEQKAERPQVLVIGDSLSPATYAQVITKLEERRFILLAIEEGEEPLSFRSAFFTMKQLLIMKHGAVGAAERIYAIAGRKSQTIREDAQANDYSVIDYPEGIEGEFAANTAAVLLPLAIKGGDIQEFVGGFYDMLSSPEWDLSGADYAMGRGAYKMAGGGGETMLIWQSQLLEFGHWEETFDQGYCTKRKSMPEDERLEEENSFETTLLIEEDQEDIMTPSFVGCNEDGSLNLLVKEEAEKYFFENKNRIPSVKIAVKRLDSYTLGQLFAFGQLSNGITKFLLNK